MSGILHKVKEAVASHAHHHHHESSNKHRAGNPKPTYAETSSNTHPHSSDLDGHGASTTTSTSSGPYLHGAPSPGDKPTFNCPWPGDPDSVSPRTSTVNASSSHGPSSYPDRSTGPASSTAGPHSSHEDNKFAPRMDSDLSSAYAREDTSRFYNEVRQGSIGGAGIIHASGSKGPTTTKTFDPHAILGGTGAHAAAPPVHSSSAAGSRFNAPGGGDT